MQVLAVYGLEFLKIRLVYRGCYIGIMEKKMETTIQGLGFN